MKRRDFLRWGAIAGAGILIRPRFGWAFSQSPGGLRKFIQELPGLGAAGIPLATKSASTYHGVDVDFYDLEAAQYHHQFHPDLNPSRLWGYADVGGTHGYLGGVIVARAPAPRAPQGPADRRRAVASATRGGCGGGCPRGGTTLEGGHSQPPRLPGRFRRARRLCLLAGHE